MAITKLSHFHNEHREGDLVGDCITDKTCLLIFLTNKNKFIFAVTNTKI